MVAPQPLSTDSSSLLLQPYMGMFTMTLDPDQIYTLTTLAVGTNKTYGPPPSSKPFPLPYKDDFNGLLP